MENLASVHALPTEGPSKIQSFVADHRGKLGVAAGIGGTLAAQKLFTVIAGWWIKRKATKAAEAHAAEQTH